MSAAFQQSRVVDLRWNALYFFSESDLFHLFNKIMFPVVGKLPLHGLDLSFVLPLTDKPDAPDTKTQIGRE